MAETKQEPPKASLAHVADMYRAYPGETVTLFTRLEILQPLDGLSLSISLPPEQVEASDYRAPTNYAADYPMPNLEIGATANYLVWQISGRVEAGTVYEYQTTLRLASSREPFELESVASLSPGGNGRATTLAQETACIAVAPKGSYLKYLPALYAGDEMMGRFLMLFESFWKPLNIQIEDLWLYFDPQLTTPDFLPWLASWIGLALDESWPEHRQRRLLAAAASLYRKRGTKEGLQEYLEIYTDRLAQIGETRAENFRLGPQTRLGPNVALGRGNQAHTFSVVLNLPPIEAESESERQRLEDQRRQTIISIIESEKPAHTRYTLELTIEDEAA